MALPPPLEGGRQPALGLRLGGIVEESEDGEHLLLTDLKTSRAAWGEEQVLQGQDQLVLYRKACGR